MSAPENMEVDKIIRLLRRVEETLKRYEHCRHGSQECFCTKEARAAVRDIELELR